MAKITVRDIDAVPTGEPEGGVILERGTARPVLCGTGDPIHLYLYQLAAGGRVEWSAARFGRVAYVRQGSAIAKGLEIGAGGCLAIEHGATASLTAPAGAELLLFGAAAATQTERLGGHVHILRSDEVPRNDDFYGDNRVGGALLLDSGCATCEMWLHETHVHSDGQETPIHFHDEDEVIVVTQGEIVLGRKPYGPGTAVAVARDTLYGFQSGTGGLRFINFRPNSPMYFPRDKSRAAIDERRFNLDKIGQPLLHTFVAAPAAPRKPSSVLLGLTGK